MKIIKGFQEKKKNIFKEDLEEAANLSRSLRVKLEEQNPHALQIKDFELFIKKDFCSSAYYFSIYFDYPERDLATILSRQINAEKRSSGEQLLKIAYNVLKGLRYLANLSHLRDSGLLQLDRGYYDS